MIMMKKDFLLRILALTAGATLTSHPASAAEISVLENGKQILHSSASEKRDPAELSALSAFARDPRLTSTNWGLAGVTQSPGNAPLIGIPQATTIAAKTLPSQPLPTHWVKRQVFAGYELRPTEVTRTVEVEESEAGAAQTTE